MHFLLIVGAVLALDQASKILVLAAIPPGTERAVLPGLLFLRPVHNFGAAFGVFPHRTMLFVAVAVVAVALMVYYYRKLDWRRPAVKVGLALAAGGAAGNLWDRVHFGFVRDFLVVRWYPAVFNVADSAIFLGIGLILVAIWREEVR
jgi:signal peptidase II